MTTFFPLGCMDYQDKSSKFLWHNTALHRLRFVSFVAEQFWLLAFKRHKGLNCLTAKSVKKVCLSDITINGQKKRREVEFTVSPEDGALALRIAVAVVVALEDLGYRMLDAVVPGTKSNGEAGEHDILAERRGLPLASSIEVKCRTIKNPKAILQDERKKLRKEAALLFDPNLFSERVVVLVEFGDWSLDAGWRIIRIEKLVATGWTPLCGFQGASAASVTSRAVTEAAVSSGGVKRKREAPSNSSSSRSSSQVNASSSADAKWVLIDGTKYATLPMYLGKTPLKSERTLADLRAFRFRVELKQGDWKTLKPFWGKEILAESALGGFRAHRWVNSVCPRAERFSKEKLQVRLLSHGQKPTSSVFLWCVTELQKCHSLRAA